MSNPQLLSGARGVIRKGDVPIGFSTDININVRTQVRPTFVMGRMNAAAIDTTAIDVDVSIGRVIPVSARDAEGGKLKAQPSTTTAIAAGLETTITAMTTAQDLVIDIQDKTTSKVIASVRGCRFSGRTLNMAAGDVATERLNYTGIWDAGYNSTENAAEEGYV